MFAGFCASLCVGLWFSMHDIFAVAFFRFCGAACFCRYGDAGFVCPVLLHDFDLRNCAVHVLVQFVWPFAVRSVELVCMRKTC